MSASVKVRLTTSLKRKAPSLPVFVVIPGNMVAPWKLTGTTIIEGSANDHSFGRRTIKAWGKGSDDWFVEFTTPFCERSSLRVGDSVALEMTLADMSTPMELEEALSVKEGLQAVWKTLTERERREAGEYVRAAKSQATREHRAASIAEKLRRHLSRGMTPNKSLERTRGK